MDVKCSHYSLSCKQSKAVPQNSTYMQRRAYTVLDPQELKIGSLGWIKCVLANTCLLLGFVVVRAFCLVSLLVYFNSVSFSESNKHLTWACKFNLLWKLRSVHRRSWYNLTLLIQMQRCHLHMTITASKPSGMSMPIPLAEPFFQNKQTSIYKCSVHISFNGI